MMPAPWMGQVPPAAFASIAALLHARSGLVLGPDKLYLLDTRLRPILKREGLHGLADLALRLRAPGAEDLAREVVEAMTTNESFFFRDEKPFTHLRDVALPRLAAARAPGSVLRLWSAAASCGQEAYSLAMLLAEHPFAGALRAEILGTDIAREPLARARAGIYTSFEVQRGLPAAMLRRHFVRHGAGWRVGDALRAAVRFQEWNLLSDLRPLGRFDVVFLRNVLIYFDVPTRARVLDKVARQMAPDGVLYLGGAETALGVTELLVPVPGGHGAYAPKPAAQATADPMRFRTGTGSEALHMASNRERPGACGGSSSGS